MTQIFVAVFFVIFSRLKEIIAIIYRRKYELLNNLKINLKLFENYVKIHINYMKISINYMKIILNC